jgi:hypothetical protein
MRRAFEDYRKVRFGTTIQAGEFNIMAGKIPEWVLLDRMSKSLDDMVILNKKILRELRGAKSSDELDVDSDKT